MTDQLLHSLQTLIETERELCHVPGTAVAVVHNGRTLLSQGFGQRDVAEALPMTSTTLFPIASSSKAFTATAVGSLVDDGLLSWDRPIREYLPGFRMWDPVATELLTLRDMLSHRSGLPRHDLMWYGNERSSRREIVDALRYLQSSLSLREGWQYNNLMYLTAGLLIELLTGDSWEDAVRARLLEPLGMAATVPSGSEAAKSDVSQGYVRRNELTELLQSRDNTLMGPAGGIWSSAEDLVHWLQVNLDNGRHDGKQVISAASLAELHRPAMLLPTPLLGWSEVTRIGYALGWEVDSYRGHRMVQHGGNLDGFSSMITLLPDDGIGVAVLTNMLGTPLRDIIPFAVSDLLLGLDPLPWGERYRTADDALTSGEREGSERRRESSTRAPFTRPLAEYAGEYRHPGYGPLRVELHAAKLQVRFGALTLAVRHLNNDAFEIIDDAMDLTIPAQFGSDLEGNSDSISVMLEPAVEPIVFQRQPPVVDAQTLAGLVGSYRRGPIEATISASGDSELHAAFGDLPATKLVARRPGVFGVEGSPQETVEFLLDADGLSSALITWSMGRFDREPGTA